MQTTIEIKGMMCENCKKHVEEALNSLEGATAIVNLEAGIAIVSSAVQISPKDLTDAVVQAGYEVISIK